MDNAINWQQKVFWHEETVLPRDTEIDPAGQEAARPRFIWPTKINAPN